MKVLLYRLAASFGSLNGLPSACYKLGAWCSISLNPSPSTATDVVLPSTRSAI